MVWIFHVILLGHLYNSFAQNVFGTLPSCPARVYSSSYFKSPAGYSNSDIQKANPKEGHLGPLSNDLMCRFKWTNRQEMISRAYEHIKNRRKVFLRFTSPVYILTNASSKCQRSSRLQTWVWVKQSHQHMLLYPHNFVILSLGAFQTITKELGDIEGWCETRSYNGSSLGGKECSLTWQEVQFFMLNVTKDTKELHDVEWELICLQLDYDGLDLIKYPHRALPDAWYYWRFLRLFLTKPLHLGKGTKKDLIHYRCYKKNGQIKEKILMPRYSVIIIIAIILWLYSPLLVHYFPSSKSVPSFCYPQGLVPQDFHPSYKSPKQFRTFLKYVFCFYMKKNQGWKARIRRVIFFICFSLVSYRILPIPGSPYFSYSFPLFSLFLIALIIPDFFSVYLKQKFPKRFLDLWPYPDGVFRQTSKTEYQLLAHCMRERIYLTSDSRFWSMLWQNSFNLLPYTKPQNNGSPIECMQWIVVSIPGIFSFLLLMVINFVYYFTPGFYFYKELIVAIGRGLKSWVFKNQYSFLVVTQSVFYGAVLLILVVYFMLTMFFWCLLLAEVTMFTYLCILLVPTIAFDYLVMIGAVGFFCYQTANDLRENYDQLRDQVVELLQNPASLDKAFSKSLQPNTLKHVSKPDGSFQIEIQKKSNSIILHYEDEISYLSRHLFDACIEACDPLRRHVGFHLLIAFLMVFYITIALWVKNIYHKEVEVSSILTIAQSTTTYVIPNLLQFLAHKSHFNKYDALRKHCVSKAIVEYANRI